MPPVAAPWWALLVLLGYPLPLKLGRLWESPREKATEENGEETF